HLLFWLSLVPFVTGWMDENHFAAVTVAAYGIVLLGAACAYTILTRALLAIHAKDSPLAKALGKDFKGKISLVIYVAALPLAFVHPWIACGLYALVRSEEHTSELQSRFDGVCRLLLEKKNAAASATTARRASRTGQTASTPIWAPPA